MINNLEEPQNYLFKSLTEKEEQLEQSKEYLQLIFDSTGNGIVVTRLDGVVIDMNRTFLNMTGYDNKNDLSGSSIIEIIPPSQHNFFHNLVQKALIRGFIEHNEVIINKKDGSLLYVELLINLINDNERKNTGLVITFKDITEKRNIEKTLNETEVKFKTLVEQLPVITYIIAVNQDKSMIYLSPQIEKLFGYAPNEFMDNKNLMKQIIHEDDIDKVIEQLLQTYAKEEPYSCEYRVKRKNGDVIWVEDQAEIIKNEDGKPLFLQGIIHDVTAQKTYEEELKNQNRFLENIFEAIPHPFYIIEVKTLDIIKSNSASKLFDFPNSKKCYHLTHNENHRCSSDKHPCPIDEIKKTGKPVRVEHIHYNHLNQPQNFEIHGYPIFDNDGNFVQMIEYSFDITSRKKAEQAIKDSEEVYRTLFDSGYDGILFFHLYDNEIPSNFIEVNDVICNILLYSKDELSNFTIYDISKDDKHQSNHILDVLTNEGKLLYETIFRAKDDTEIPVEISGRYFFYKNIPSVLLIVKDISERKQINEELLKLRKAVESSREAIFLTDKNGIFTYVNPEFTNMYGYKPEEVIGKTTPRILKGGAVSEKEYQHFWKLIKSVPFVKIEWINKTKYQTLLSIDASVNQILDEENNIIGFLAIQRNITEKKKSEIAIKEQKELIETIFRSVNDSICVIDEHGTIIEVNNAWESFRNKCEKNEFKKLQRGRNYLEVIRNTENIYGKKTNMIISNVEAIIEKGKIFFETDFQFDDKKNVKWFNVYLTPLIGSKKGALIIHNDITARKDAEDKLVKSASELEESNKELQDFAYIASHDLQEPLRKVTTFGERLSAKYYELLGEQGRDYLNRMQNAAFRMQSLINDLLSYSRIKTRAKPFSDVNLNEIVVNVLSDLEISIEKSNAKTIIENDLPIIKADKTQIRQLFQNLLSNAIKYHEPKTSPVINIKSTIFEEDNENPNNSNRKMCSVFIKDNGIGFDEKYLDKVFDIFSRLHGKNSIYQGTGMGLAICKKIVERHGGSISARSVINQGSEFIVNLPLNHDVNSE